MTTAVVVRPGTCAHPSITDAAIVEGVEAAFRYWDSNLSTKRCPDCGETLFPSGDDDTIVVAVGEPIGAGDER